MLPTFIRNINKNIWIITTINTLLAVSTTMAFSISPFFITSVLGLSVFSMGTIEGVAEAIAQFSRLGSGVAKDYSRKTKPLLFVAILIALISKPFFIFAKTFNHVICSKVLERLSNGLFGTPRDAFVGEIAESNDKGRAFGVLMTGRTIGAIFGPFLIAALFCLTKDYTVLLWISFFPTLFALALVFRLKEVKNITNKQDQIFRWQHIKNLSRDYWIIITFASLFMLARFNDGILALRLKQLGAPDYVCLATIGIFNATSFLCCIPIGVWSDKCSRKIILLFPYLSLVLCNICFLYDSVLLALIGTLLWGCQRGTSQVLFTALVADTAPKNVLGTAMGIFYFMSGIVSVIACSTGGLVADRVGLRSCFIYGLICSGVASLCLVIKVLTSKHSLK